MSSKLAKKQFLMPKLPPDLTVRRYKTQTVIKSTKKNKPTKSTSLLKKSDAKLLKKDNKNALKEVLSLQLAEENEYYPDKLKRNMSLRKIVLKPKYNMKVVAGTNKRKRGTPKKDISTNSTIVYSEQTSSTCDTDFSMCDAVRLADETRSLTDEDFMEILTCPSPVWWEDPPHAEFIEDAIFRLPDEKTIKENQLDSQSNTQTSCDSRADGLTRPPTSSDTLGPLDPHVDFEQEINHFKIKTDKFIQKKKKLENLLDNIMNKTNGEVKRRLSESTEGEDFSDLSLNEEEILEHLENLDIPMEDSRSEDTDKSNENPIKMDVEHSRSRKETADTTSDKSERDETTRNSPKENLNKECQGHSHIISGNDKKSTVVVKNANTSLKDGKIEQNFQRVNVKSILVNNENVKVSKNIFIESIIDQNISSIDTSSRRNKRNKNNTGFIKVRSDLIKSEFNLDVPNKLPPLTRKPAFKSDINNIDLSTVNIDSISDSNIRFISDEDSDEIFTDKNDIEINLNEITGKNELPKKLINDLTEYITVYKIMSKDEKKEINNETPEITKINDNVVELNNFFKKCKGNKRLKKTNAVDGDDIKRVENSDANEFDKQNRLNGCDYCIVKSVNGGTDFSCDTCDTAALFSCDLCSFRSNTKEVIINHVSRCNKYNRTIVMC